MSTEKIPIVQIPSEIAAGTRGSSLGVEAIEFVSYQHHDGFFKDREVIWVEEENRILQNEEEESPYAKRISTFQKVFWWIEETMIVQAINYHKTIILSGDHGNSAGVIKGIRKAHPTQKMGVIWIDAHADIHSPYTTPSGNIHGMPLAITLGLDNKKFQKNTPDPKTIEIWEELKELEKGAEVKLIYVAVRDTEIEENAIISEQGIPSITVQDITKKGVNKIVHQIKEYLSDCDFSYVSFDVDSMDPDLVSQGTGTPVPGGLSFQQVKTLVSTLLTEIPTIRFFEITEVNPLLDQKGNTMAQSAYELLKIVDKSL